MRTNIAICATGLTALVCAGSLRAHHSGYMYETTPIWVRGAVARFERTGPHTITTLEDRSVPGQVRRWAVEGPPIRQIGRMGFATDALKPGTVIEVCGYAPKENTVWQIASTAPGAVSMAGRLLDVEMLVLADGKEQSWGDYGVHKCFSPGYRDVHSR